MTKDIAGLHKIFSWKNVLDIHQLLANQTDINTTVSSRLSGTTVQSCMEVFTGRTAPTPSQQRRCFSDKLPLQVTRPSARNTGLRGWRHLLPAAEPQQQQWCREKWAGAAPANPTSRLGLWAHQPHSGSSNPSIPPSLAGMATSSCARLHTAVLTSTKIKNEKVDRVLSKPCFLSPYYKKSPPSTLLCLLTSNLWRTSTAPGIQDVTMGFLSLFFPLKSVHQVLSEFNKRN